MVEKKNNRRQQILEAFAVMLEREPGGRITTAALAREVGVSEAALYRHFPSKAKMFEGLIEFIEESIFSRINRASEHAAAESESDVLCGQIISLLLTFAERNPGITRLLTGDVLAGETPRLRARIVQFFDRLETELRTILRTAESHRAIRLRLSPHQCAETLLAFAQGKLANYVRSNFERTPTTDWPNQWSVLQLALFLPPLDPDADSAGPH